MTPLHLTGPNLALREVEPEDTDDLLAIYGDPEATRHLSFEPRTRNRSKRSPPGPSTPRSPPREPSTASPSPGAANTS
ncbi:GNAT family N-acetyltransferase [Kitasatospora sp. MY 5-36]|uniref:GNAT family N-acetyltransferase n=1 Tax=Kitasatospora sp. MY 5-36 TaxID=1678027 RepID=UPI00351007C5